MLPTGLRARGPVREFMSVSVSIESLGITVSDIIRRQIFDVHLGFVHPMM